MEYGRINFSSNTTENICFSFSVSRNGLVLIREFFSECFTFHLRTNLWRAKQNSFAGWAPLNYIRPATIVRIYCSNLHAVVKTSPEARAIPADFPFPCPTAVSVKAWNGKLFRSSFPGVSRRDPFAVAGFLCIVFHYIIMYSKCLPFSLLR